jgi:HEAT repeat protein
MESSSSRPDQVIALAKKLLAAGKTEEAQSLLLDEGYVRRLEPAIQKAYLRLIPVGATLRAVLDEMYRGLTDSDPKVRLKAATQIAREFNKTYLRDKVRWMRDPRASGPLIDAAHDPDGKVSERALGALSRLVCKYFPDRRALPVFLTNLADKRQQFRAFAISGLGCLRDEALLTHLVDLLQNGTDDDRLAVCSLIWGLSTETIHHANQRPMEWSAVGRKFWREKLTTTLKHPRIELRKCAARALANLGDRQTIGPLQAARDVERDEDTAYYMDEALKAIGSRA